MVVVASVVVGLVSSCTTLVGFGVQNMISQRDTTTTEAIANLQHEIDTQRTAILEMEAQIKQGLAALEKDRLVSETQFRRDEIGLAQERFQADKVARKEQVLVAQVPKLLASSDSDRRAALAVLFVLYPNDAQDIVRQASAAVQEEQKVELDQALLVYCN